MRILLVSYFAEAHLSNSSAQNTRFLAEGLLGAGHEVRVVCAGYKGETITQNGYQLTKIPLTGPHWDKQWLGGWRPDPKIRSIAQEIIRDWKPDVLYMGAWNFLSEFVFAAKERGIPVIQMVHDYSILCLRQWLVDSWGNVCSGPTTAEKCADCIRHDLGWKDRVKDMAFSVPGLGEAIWPKARTSRQWGIHAGRVVGEAYSYTRNYRDQIDLFIAQSPMVIDLLQTGGVEPGRCRLVPQYIGEDKLQKYPRASGTPGLDRPLRFVYVGRWSVEKGTDLLLDAFLGAEASIPTTLWIVSKNADAEAIHTWTMGRMPSNKTIEVFNNLKGQDVSQRLAQADVCVVPSLNPETGSRVVLEAQAQGVPVVVSSMVGNRYLVREEVNGRIFQNGDVEGLRKIMEEVIHHPSTIQAWSANAIKPINLDEWMGKVLDVFYEAQRKSLQTPHSVSIVNQSSH